MVVERTRRKEEERLRKQMTEEETKREAERLHRVYIMYYFKATITARMYFHCRTYFPIITDLAIITLMISMCICACSSVFQDGTCNTIPYALYIKMALC